METTTLARWFFSITVASALTFGTAGYAFTEDPASAEKVNVLVSFTEKSGSAEKALIHNEGGKVKRTYHIVPTIAASIPKGKLNSLRSNPKVASIEEDITVQILEDTPPWEVDRIDAEIVHSQNKGRGVKVAILDTGIDLDHPDLRVAGDVTFVPGTTSGDDDHGHGTMVAGVVAALDNDIGVAGIAPEVELYSVKVLNKDCAGVMSVILSGIEWAIANDMQVINMSFGCLLNFPQAVRTALDKAYQAGIVLVAGAGNEGTASGEGNNIWAPARYTPVIAVGATNEPDNRYSSSSTGDTLELVAPGVNIHSTAMGGGYASITGTSVSSPYTAGVAALLIASGVSSNIEVRQILQATAKDLGPPGWDSWYGYGLVNGAETVGMSSPSTATPDGVVKSESSDNIPPTSDKAGSNNGNCSS